MKIEKSSNDDYDLYIFAEPYGKLIDEGGFVFNKKQLPQFIDNIKEGKKKYIEWVKIAKDNEIKDFEKQIKIENIPKCKAFFYLNQWHYDNSVSPVFKFSVSEYKNEIIYYFHIKAFHLTSRTNEFIKSKGIYIPLSSIKQIDDFISKISDENIQKFLAKPKVEDLFED